jgi:hypothetical protein
MSVQSTLVGFLLPILLVSLAHAHEGKVHLKGTISAADATRIVVQTTDGKTVSVLRGGQTSYEQMDKPAGAADLRVGDRVVIETTGEEETLTASDVHFSRPPAPTSPVDHEKHDAH